MWTKIIQLLVFRTIDIVFVKLKKRSCDKEARSAYKSRQKWKGYEDRPPDA
jgi:hypothetical protein